MIVVTNIIYISNSILSAFSSFLFVVSLLFKPPSRSSTRFSPYFLQSVFFTFQFLLSSRTRINF